MTIIHTCVSWQATTFISLYQVHASRVILTFVGQTVVDVHFATVPGETGRALTARRQQHG